MPEMVCYIRLRQSRPDGVTQGEASAVLEVKVIVDDQPIGIISPRLYGHFAEHLGRCCYGGLWTGLDAGAAQTEGFRSDVLAALRELGVTMIRWPGGCYVDHYHWRNGIGAPATRPATLGMSCGQQVPDDNSLGTHLAQVRVAGGLHVGAARCAQPLVQRGERLGRVEVVRERVEEPVAHGLELGRATGAGGGRPGPPGAGA